VTVFFVRTGYPLSADAGSHRGGEDERCCPMEDLAAIHRLLRRGQFHLPPALGRLALRASVPGASSFNTATSKCRTGSAQNAGRGSAGLPLG
jgi:hypothetical protein